MSSFVIFYGTVIRIGTLGGTKYVHKLMFDLIFIHPTYFPIVIANFILNKTCSKEDYKDAVFCMYHHQYII